MINYTSAFAETLELAKPQLEELKAMLNGVIEDISKKLGVTLGKAVVDTIKSIIGEIPLAGGVLDGITSVVQLAENLVKTCLPVVTKGAGALPIINKINAEYAKTKNDVNCLIKKVEPIMKKFEGHPAASTSQTGGCGGDGMRSCGGGNNKKKIEKATLRVKKMLKRFTRRQIKPVNYARRLQFRQ